MQDKYKAIQYFDQENLCKDHGGKSNFNEWLKALYQKTRDILQTLLNMLTKIDLNWRECFLHSCQERSQ